MSSIAEVLSQGEQVLVEAGVAEPRRDSFYLLAFILGRDKTYLYAHPEEDLTAEQLAKFKAGIIRRTQREPLQYITGSQEFYRRSFEVTQDVLIPRPETEMVVDQALRLLSDGGQFCDVGTGSGCIAISILAETSGVTGVAVDISPAALGVARRNSITHGVEGRLRFFCSDVFEALDDQTERFDIIVANPPYVAPRDLEGLQAEVRDFEPSIALTDGLDGLAIIRKIIIDAPRFLHHGGSLLMEIGFDQSSRVTTLFSQEIWHTPDLLPDIQGIPRLVSATLRAEN